MQQRLQKCLDVLLDVFGFRHRSVPFDHLTGAIDEEFGEVPFNRFTTQQTRSSMGQVLKQGMGVGTIHVNFLEQGEGDTKAGFTEGLDRAIAARFLLTELVTGEAQNHQPLVRILGIQLLQALVLRGKAALTGGIDNQQHFVLKGAEGSGLAFDAGGREIVDGWGGLCGHSSVVR
jgi:hypothetical protein